MGKKQKVRKDIPKTTECTHDPRTCDVVKRGCTYRCPKCGRLVISGKEHPK
jgi:predicted RNA-binding Zn-ribbon protein involved in translation (DUF1610 family)